MVRQFHYMRSSSLNPQVRTPVRCDFPAQVVRSTSYFDGNDPSSAGRPINRRLYVSPSWWIAELETDGKKGVCYTDYALCQGFHDFWKRSVKMEEHIQRTHSASRPPSMRRSRSVDTLPAARDTRIKFAGRESLVSTLTPKSNGLLLSGAKTRCPSRETPHPGLFRPASAAILDRLKEKHEAPRKVWRV